MQEIPNQGLFAVNGDNMKWQAMFQGGKFEPVTNAHLLQGTQVRYGPNVIHVHQWTGHGSIFNWNPIIEAWDEFDLAEKKVTCTWFRKGVQKIQPNALGNICTSNGFFSANGNSVQSVAQFDNGEFKPLETCIKELKSNQVVSSCNFTYIKNWSGHGSIFMFNPEKQAWEEFDLDQNQVTFTWYKCDNNLLQLSQSLNKQQISEKDQQALFDNEGCFAPEGNDKYWQIEFRGGKFIPLQQCSGYLKGDQTNAGSNFIQVYNWCGHGSIFSWNPQTFSWDEFDQSKNEVTVKWYRMQGHPQNEEQLYSPDGNPEHPYKAQFINGKFTPKGTAEQYLKSEVTCPTPTYCIAADWQGHPSIFIYNPISKGYDEYNVSQKKVTTRWQKIKL